MAILRDFALSCSDLHASKNEVRDFKYQTRFVCSLVSRLTPKLKNEKYKKLLVQCRKDGPTRQEAVPDQLGVAFVEVKRDPRVLLSLPKEAKARWAFDALREGVIPAPGRRLNNSKSTFGAALTTSTARSMQSSDDAQG